MAQSQGSIAECAFCCSKSVPGRRVTLSVFGMDGFRDHETDICAVCVNARLPVEHLQSNPPYSPETELLRAMMRTANYILARLPGHVADAVLNTPVKEKP